jgi:hypothetical protein
MGRVAVALCAVLLVSTSLALGGPSRELSRAGYGQGEPFLLVETRGGNFVQDQERVELVLGFSPRTRGPGRIAIRVPRGVILGAGALPGTPLGTALVELLTSEGRPQELRGSIAVVPLTARLAETGRKCSTTEHVGAWVLRLASSNGVAEIPIYVDTPNPQDPSGPLALDVCLDALARTGEPAPAVWSIALSFTRIVRPPPEGLHMWRAVVTPLSPDRRGLRPGEAYEVRGLVPVPYRLTLRGRYLPKSRVALLEGSLRARGRPRSRREVAIVRLDREVTDTGLVVRDAAIALTRTLPNGRYAVRVPTRHTRGFLAYAMPVVRACGESELAPAGCASITTGGVESDPVTIGVP